MTTDNINTKKSLPVVVLRETVLFPGISQQLDIVRKRSIAAVRAAISDGQEILIVMQRDSTEDDPDRSSLHDVGVIASIKQVLKHPSSETMRIHVECRCRAEIRAVAEQDEMFVAFTVQKDEIPVTPASHRNALSRALSKAAKQYFHMSGIKSNPGFFDMLSGISDAGQFSDIIAHSSELPSAKKQELLEIFDHAERCETLASMLFSELELLRLQKDIEEKVQQNIDKGQKDYYLREQLKVISDQLGEGDSPIEESEEYIEKIESADLPEEISEALISVCRKLGKLPQGSHEAAVERNYLDVCLSLPWNKKSEEQCDVAQAAKILDRDHYGLEKVKERILEFIAVRALAPDIKGQIICLVGPPGVGKTSIARSVAEALGRKYVRVSLGGVHDEADIRGHRKTYIGAMPGRIANALKLAGTSNPLILLDEVDKLANDFRGDPTSALLEVLDPEQNFSFHDHYIELPLDLSNVMFITTANDFDRIPGPLTDRMEVIELSSYTHEEKLNIAKLHLVKKQLSRHGLSGKTMRVSSKALSLLIDGYTREAGVRSLEREIASLCRKAAKQIASGEADRVSVTDKNLPDFLGPVKFKKEQPEKKPEPGLANGLAWTSVGGTMLEIEVAILDGTGAVELTGSLGDVMKESARTAISFIRSRAAALGIDPAFHKNKDIHIHVPEGATPKDGPSAGITMATAIISALTGISVRGDVAMTGEITLRGRVLAIGGLREKSMAAYIAGIKKIIIPKDNFPEVEKLCDAVKDNVEFVPAEKLDDVLVHALTVMPKPFTAPASNDDLKIKTVTELPQLPFIPKSKTGGNNEAGESLV